MTETTLIKNHIKSDPNTADRWRILAEGMTTITATTDRISLATCVETVIQDMFNTVKCLILLIDQHTTLSLIAGAKRIFPAIYHQMEQNYAIGLTAAIPRKLYKR